MPQNNKEQPSQYRPEVPENSGQTNAGSRRRGAARAAGVVLAGVLVGGGIGVVAANSLDSDRSQGISLPGVEAFPHHQEAAVVASRFECELTDVKDERRHPDRPLDPSMTRLEDYTTVNITVSTRTKDDTETRAVLERYKDDDTLWWLEPEVSGSLYDGDKTLDQMPMIIGSNSIGFDDGEYTMPVGLHTDYPEGTRVLITLNNTVNIMNSDTSIDASQVCGAVEFVEGAWQAAADTPAVDPVMIPRQD